VEVWATSGDDRVDDPSRGALVEEVEAENTVVEDEGG
jgi:hypothetical protein